MFWNNKFNEYLSYNEQMKKWIKHIKNIIKLLGNAMNKIFIPIIIQNTLFISEKKKKLKTISVLNYTNNIYIYY